MTSYKNTQSKYRPDIDGLRAFAVLVVVAFHAFPGYSPGGFIGVDVFFVISGYLITGIILEEQTIGSFSYSVFYAKRFRRILPALIVVLVAIFVAGRYVLLEDELRSLGKHILAGSAFASNILLWYESGYFDAASESKPLLHLWSLGVEEQYYLLWPLLLVFWRKRGLNLIHLFAGLFIVSFALNVALIETYPIATFYMLPTRFWELLMGGGLAMLVTRQFPNSSWYSSLNPRRFFCNCISIVGGLTLVGATLILNKEKAYPGWWALVPTFASCALILAGPSAWINKKLLSSKSAVLVGKISYPLYLWHWPILSLAFIAFDENPSRAVRISAVLLSFVLASLTYVAVERPIRASLFVNDTPERKVRAFLISGACVLMGSALLGVGVNSGYFTLPTQQNIGIYGAAYEGNHGKEFSCENPISVIDSGCRLDGAKSSIAIWGDSHSWHLFPGVENAFKQNASVHQFQRGGCPPLWDHEHLDECAKFNEKVIAALTSSPPDTVILAARWQAYFVAQGFFERLDHSISILRSAGVRHIVVIGHTPTWTPFLYRIAVRKFISKGEAFPVRTSIGLDQWPFVIDEAMKKHRWGDGVTFVSLIDSLCNSEGCITMAGTDIKSDLITYDYGHFTVPGSIFVFEKAIRPVLAPKAPNREVNG